MMSTEQPLESGPDARSYLTAVEDWKRVRSAIEHENNLVNHRQTWHATLQFALVGAMFVVYSELGKAKNNSLPLQTWIPLLVLPVVGMWVSIFIQIAILAAVAHMKTLEQWWRDHYSKEGPDSYLLNHPHINGIFKKDKLKDLNTAFIPTLFSVAWGTAFVVSLITIAAEIFPGSIVWTVLALIIGVIVGYGLHYLGQHLASSKGQAENAPLSEPKP